MYSSSYKNRPGTVTAFEDAYAKEEFLRRNADAKNLNGCTPYSDNANIHKKYENKSDSTEESKENREVTSCEKKPPSFPDKPKKDTSGLFAGIDGGDMLLILLILFFMLDKDTENDSIIPVLLALVLLF